MNLPWAFVFSAAINDVNTEQRKGDETQHDGSFAVWPCFGRRFVVGHRARSRATSGVRRQEIIWRLIFFRRWGKKRRCIFE